MQTIGYLLDTLLKAKHNISHCAELRAVRFIDTESADTIEQVKETLIEARSIIAALNGLYDTIEQERYEAEYEMATTLHSVFAK